MPPTRLAFVDVPRMLRELVVALVDEQAAVVVCAEDLTSGDLATAVLEHQADVVVGGHRLADPVEVCRLLTARPGLQAIVILDGGRRCACYELRPTRTLRELSAESLLAAVRLAGLPCAARLTTRDRSLD